MKNVLLKFSFVTLIAAVTVTNVMGYKSNSKGLDGTTVAIQKFDCKLTRNATLKSATPLAVFSLKLAAGISAVVFTWQAVQEVKQYLGGITIPTRSAISEFIELNNLP